MPYSQKRRNIRNIREEGFEFFLILQYIAHFYTDIMRGQTRHDGPETVIKYSRDWEYPWVLIKSEIHPGCRTLDCGSGYSPVPFVMSMFGAKAHAIDKDMMVCSRSMYAMRCSLRILSDILQFPLIILQKIMGKKVACNYNYICRIWKPDFWGPISPGFLKAYNVDYRNGDLLSLPYKEDYFDIVSCISVLEHMSPEDRVKGIKEMARVTKKGGKLIITYDEGNEDISDVFIKESGMVPSEVVCFSRPDSVYDKKMPNIMGICLVK